MASPLPSASPFSSAPPFPGTAGGQCPGASAGPWPGPSGGDPGPPQPVPGGVDNPPLASLHNAVIGVRALGFTDVAQYPSSGKAHRQYCFALLVPGLESEQEVRFRFSTFREAHQALPGIGILPNFPSRHPLRDMNKEANAQQRSGELLRYLQVLLNRADTYPGIAGGVTMSARFHAALGCGPGLAAGLRWGRHASARNRTGGSRSLRIGTSRSA